MVEPPHTTSRSNKAVTASLQHYCKRLPRAASSSLRPQASSVWTDLLPPVQAQLQLCKGHPSCPPRRSHAELLHRGEAGAAAEPPARPRCPHVHAPQELLALAPGRAGLFFRVTSGKRSLRRRFLCVQKSPVLDSHREHGKRSQAKGNAD